MAFSQENAAVVCFFAHDRIDIACFRSNGRANIPLSLCDHIHWHAGWSLQGEIVAAEGLGEFLDGVAEHGAGHRGGIFIKEEFQAVLVALAGFAEHPADGLVHQVVLMMHQFDGQRVSVIELAVSD